MFNLNENTFKSDDKSRTKLHLTGRIYDENVSGID